MNTDELKPCRLRLDDAATPPPAHIGPPASDIALFRILANRCARLSALDPIKGARAIPEMLKAFEIVATSRLKSPTPLGVLVNKDLTEDFFV